MKLRPSFLALTIALTFAASLRAASMDEQFRAPPASAGPWVYWIWINGNVTQEGIRADLEDMRRTGIRGAMLFEGSLYLPAGPVRYGTDAWHANVQFAIRTAAELGLEIVLMNCAGWATSGGPWNSVENSMKMLTWNEQTISGGARWSGRLALPPSQLDFYRDIAVLAVPAAPELRVTNLAEKTGLKSSPPFSSPVDWDASPVGFSARDVVDLTGQLSADGTLTWDAPPGSWRVMRFGFTTAARKNQPAPPEGTGLEVDKLDRAAVAHHFEQSLGRIIREAGPHAGHALAGVLSDSWEAGPQTWTDALPAEFARRRGYVLTAYLPALAGRVIGTRAETEAFLADYRRTLGELYAENYYGGLQELAHAHGMRLFAEPYGGVLDEPRALARVDVPMVEFWNHGLYKALDFTPGAAHLAGNPQVLAEAFTSRPPVSGWIEHPALLKPHGDAAFAAGVTGFVLHSYVHQPRSDLAPGFTHGRYGTQFGRLNSWWPLAGAWIDYVRRCTLLLQQGRAVVDILRLHEDRLKTEFREIPVAPLPGYQQDHATPAQLPLLHVEDGWLVSAGGARYRALVLPEQWTATAATLRDLARLHAAGALLVGPAPFAPASLLDTGESRSAWDAAVAAIWRSGHPPATDLANALSAVQLAPDFRCREDAAGTEVKFAHRASPEGDFYFVTNQSGRALAATLEFRVGDRAPELWDAVRGTTLPAPAYAVAEGRTSLTLQLDAADSVWVVFRHARPAVWPVAVQRDGSTLALSVSGSQPAAGRWPGNQAGTYSTAYSDGTIKSHGATAAARTVPINGPWQVSFRAPRHSPAPRGLPQLTSLTEHSEPAVKYFSGLTTYETRFAAPSIAADARVVLDLGEVHDLARITLNGRELATLWRAPFTLDITAALHPNENVLQIEVANRWVNRLIGDENLPADATYVTRGSSVGALAEFPAWWSDPAAARRERAAFSTWRFHQANTPLLPAGLVGPVRMQVCADLLLSR